MKSHKNILHKATGLLMAIALVCSISGCEKVFEKSLDRVSDSRLTFEDVLADATKVQGLFNSCYAGMMKSRVDLYMWNSFESLADNAFDDRGPSLMNWRSGVLSPTQSAVYANNSTSNSTVGFGEGGSFWGRYWAAIRACNTLINNMDNVTAPLDDLDQNDRDKMVDEAKLLRAYYHFLIISMYGPVPFMEEVHDVNYSGWATLERPTYDEIANKIADELQAVIDNGIVPFVRDQGKPTDKYRIPLSFAYGLKSRVLLYNASPLNNPEGDPQKYQKAADAAKQLLDLETAKLEPFENTKKALYNSSIEDPVEQVEIIWRAKDPLRTLSNVGGMNLKETVPPLAGFVNFKAGETPTQEIVDCYELKTGELIVENYDPTHAKPTFTAEAIAAGYDDVNSPYANRDDRFYRDILFNGSYFGVNYDQDSIYVYTYLGCKGTGTNGNVTTGDAKNTFTGYYFGKDRDPIYYGKTKHNSFCNQHSVLMRYAEIYLNYAEALCGANKLSEACDALDMTRLRAHQLSIKEVPGFTLDKAWLMKRIYNERRVELVLEDHRFYDVRRWDIISHQNHNTISGMLVEKVGDTEQYTHTRYQIPFAWECHNEKYKILPIPSSDQKNMPLMLQPEAWR